jgi:ADP-heptose:LPS heptosyltransferase
VFKHLQVYDRRERLLVGCTDALLVGCAPIARVLLNRAASGVPPRHILLLRLERIGDLVMALDAIDAVRARAPEASIHLVVGSWNEPLARLVKAVDSVETLDVPWLNREGPPSSAQALAARAWAWRAQRFDLAVNFEPDIRTNLLLALSGAPERVGFASGGGGRLLTRALMFDPNAHTAANLARLVDAALPVPAREQAAQRLRVPEDARREASRLFGGLKAPFIGIHPGGGRLIKQWEVERFAQVAAALAHDLSGTIVITGGPPDRPLGDQLRSQLPTDVKTVDLIGALALPVLAGVLDRLSLLLTCDTGPMHLAAALGTPVVALFGPSDPARYGPLTKRSRVLVADLWCRPCNRVRRPPARCTATGRSPNCLASISSEDVYRAARDLLANADLTDSQTTPRSIE